MYGVPYNLPANPMQQTVYLHRAVQKSIGQKKPSSYVPVADGFVSSSGSTAVPVSSAEAAAQKIEPVGKDVYGNIGKTCK